MTVNFSDIYDTAYKIYNHASEGKVLPSIHYLNQFYKEAEQIKDNKSGVSMPTAAKMALQQAYVDTLEMIADDYAEELVDNEEFIQKNKNVASLAIEIQSSPKMKELDKKIRQSHKKTASKRLAIIPCLMDSYSNGLGAVKHSTGFEKTETLLYKFASYIVKKMNPAIVSLEEEIVENKGMKKFLYYMNKITMR